MNTLFVVTDTAGRWLYKEPPSDPRQPSMVRLSWLFEGDSSGGQAHSRIVFPEPMTRYEPGAVAFHGIDRAFATENGLLLSTVMAEFTTVLAAASAVVVFGAKFQMDVLASAFAASGVPQPIVQKDQIIDALIEAQRLLHRSAPRDFASCYEHVTNQPLRLSSDPQLAGIHRVQALQAIWRGVVARQPA